MCSRRCGPASFPPFRAARRVSRPSRLARAPRDPRRIRDLSTRGRPPPPADPAPDADRRRLGASARSRRGRPAAVVAEAGRLRRSGCWWLGRTSRARPAGRGLTRCVRVGGALRRRPVTRARRPAAGGCGLDEPGGRPARQPRRASRGRGGRRRFSPAPPRKVAGAAICHGPAAFGRGRGKGRPRRIG